MIGLFPKDIWGMIFENFERDFDPISLNNLSLTCKQLNYIDIQRRKIYIKNYEKTERDVETYKKGRQDYVTLLKYLCITKYVHSHAFYLPNYLNVYKFAKLLKISNLSKTEVLTENQLTTFLITVINICIQYYNTQVLIKRNCSGAPLYCCLLTYIEYNRNIPKCISHLHTFYF